MERRSIRLLITALMLIGLPVAGILVSGRPFSLYLEFPPETRHVEHQPFSWVYFVAMALFLAVIVAPFLARALRCMGWGSAAQGIRRRALPWWGWAGVVLTGVSWLVAWTDAPCPGSLQAYTFTPLWVGYILVVNALVLRRSGASPLTHRTRSYLLLFPSSALFWWFFEYLNRFVQNWHYVGENLDPWSYFWSATLPFSTVIPAVLATKALVETCSWPQKAFSQFIKIKVPAPKVLAWVCLGASGLGLALIGVSPNYTYPLLWISPLIIIVSLEEIAGRPHVFSPVVQGDWREIVTASSAALLCGFFWEMWNIYSFPKWEYSIPFVHRFEIFEMPLLGYAGYLPFGVECLVVADLLLGWRKGHGR